VSPDEALTALTSARRRLLSELEGLDDERFARVPPGETWSTAHVAEHLVRVESRVTNGAKIALEKGTSVRPRLVDPLLQLTIRLGIVDFVRVRTVPSADPLQGSPASLLRLEMLDRLAKTRADSVAFLEGVRGRDFSRTWLRHPFFGAFTVPDMYGWVAWHEERHRRQVSRLRRALGLR
jgi:hypothetical protein